MTVKLNIIISLSSLAEHFGRDHAIESKMEEIIFVLIQLATAEIDHKIAIVNCEIDFLLKKPLHSVHLLVKYIDEAVKYSQKRLSLLQLPFAIGKQFGTDNKKAMTMASNLCFITVLLKSMFVKCILDFRIPLTRVFQLNTAPHHSGFQEYQ
jgi:hypothetical protein